jgi:precorrin-3B C17-methyltransferase
MVDAVAGYTTYIDLIRPLIHGKAIVSTPMTKEVERVQSAIEIARSGKRCAIVSSGDPGIYAMAGLVFEICREIGIPVIPLSSGVKDRHNLKALQLEIVPGVPALCAGASLLGAPLTHDFAAVSLSDLLTPWEMIERRLRAAAEADFVVVLYNPKSKRRGHQLESAQKILMEYRDPRTPVGLVTGAMRSNQQVRIVSLENLMAVPADMQTTIFIGNRTSAVYRDFMFTPRGYSDKYALDHQEKK